MPEGLLPHKELPWGRWEGELDKKWKQKEEENPQEKDPIAPYEGF